MDGGELAVRPIGHVGEVVKLRLLATCDRQLSYRRHNRPAKLGSHKGELVVGYG